MKKIPMLIFLVILVTPSFSQTTGKGLWFQKEEQYGHAFSSFRETINLNQNNDTAWFYLGDLYFKLQRYDSSEICYQKAATLNSENPFAVTGLGKIQLYRKNKEQAQSYFEKARKMGKKNIDVMISIADGYMMPDTRDTLAAHTWLNNALNVNSKNPKLYIKLGDLYYLENNLGKAANAYDAAIYYNKANSEAHVKLGVLYTSANNFPEAFNAFTEATGLEPGLIIAYKYLGDICYTYGKYKDAQKAYETYFQRGEITISDKERFALILFFTKNFSKADSIMEEVIKIRPNSPVLYRIQGYIAYETAEFAKGLEYMNNFFKIQDPNKILASDYEYYGKLLIKNGKDSLGIINLEKSIDLDSSKVYNYEEIARIHVKNDNHVEAARYYHKVVTHTQQEKVNVSFSLGKEYFYEGNKNKAVCDTMISTNKAKKTSYSEDVISAARIKYEGYYNQADSCFKVVSQLSTKSHHGYIWRARCWAILDPESLTDSAKIQYEKVLGLIEVSDNPTKKKNIKETLECYRYFGSYYYLKSEREKDTNKSDSKADRDTSISYWQKILLIDPNDQQAITVLKGLKQKPQ
jgi:tetratricopeptide (TPR) repeat protein